MFLFFALFVVIMQIIASVKQSFNLLFITTYFLMPTTIMVYWFNYYYLSAWIWSIAFVLQYISFDMSIRYKFISPGK